MRYPVSVFECWLLVWVLLDTIPTLATGADSDLQCDAPIDIRVMGTNATNILADFVEILCNEVWMPVCDNMWNRNDAGIVCRTSGFTLWANLAWLDDISNCPTTPTVCPISSSTCDCPYPTVQTANTSPSSTLTSLTLQATPEHATPTTGGGKGEEQREGPVSCTAIGGGLGALAAGLGLALVGVVMGWVWHCYNNNRKPCNFKEERPKGSNFQPMTPPLSPTLSTTAPVYEIPDIIQPHPSAGTVSKTEGMVTDSNPSYGTVSDSGGVVTDSNPSYGTSLSTLTSC